MMIDRYYGLLDWQKPKDMIRKREKVINNKRHNMIRLLVHEINLHDFPYTQFSPLFLMLWFVLPLFG